MIILCTENYLYQCNRDLIFSDTDTAYGILRLLAIQLLTEQSVRRSGAK